MSSTNEHFAHILKHGLAKNNRFQVIIPLPPALQSQTSNVLQEKASSILGEDVVSMVKSFVGGSNEITRGLDMMIEQTILPGKNIVTSDIRYNSDYYKLPYGVVYEAQSFTFRSSKDLHEKNILDKWMELIFNPVTHEVAYMDDFATNIVINQLDEQDNVVYTVILRDAYPTICDSMPLTNEDQDTVHRITCQFMYRRWDKGQTTGSSGLIDSLSQTPLGPYVTPVLSNPAVQKGLEVFEDNTGLDLEGEAVNIYNQVDSIVRETTDTSINQSVSIIENIKASTKVNGRVSNDQKAKVIGVIDNALGGLRS